MSKSNDIYNALDYARNRLKSATEAKGAAVASPYSLMDIAAAVQTIENGLEVGVLVSDSTGLKVQPLGFEGTSATVNGTAESYAAKIFNTGKDEPAYASGSGGTSAEYYKCASVDTEAKTWSGYKAVFDSGTGTWSFESGVTEGLTYTTVTPQVGSIYSADALVIVDFMVTDGKVTIPESGLLLYMPLKTSTEEVTGKNVTNTGTVMFTTESGIQCAQFDGSQYFYATGVGLPNGTQSTGATFTLSFWAKRDSSNQTSMAIFNLPSDKGIFYLNPTSVRYAAIANSITYEIQNTVDMDKWHHYAITMDKYQFKLYVDGLRVVDDGFYKFYISSINNLYIGTNANYTSEDRFIGYLAAYRYYNITLSDAEIMALAKELSPTA